MVEADTMGCVYSDFDGLCTLWSPNIESKGTDINGYCIVEDDEDPLQSCEDYEPNE